MERVTAALKAFVEGLQLKDICDYRIVLVDETTTPTLVSVELELAVLPEIVQRDGRIVKQMTVLIQWYPRESTFEFVTHFNLGPIQDHVYPILLNMVNEWNMDEPRPYARAMAGPDEEGNCLLEFFYPLLVVTPLEDIFKDPAVCMAASVGLSRFVNDAVDGALSIPEKVQEEVGADGEPMRDDADMPSKTHH